MGMPYIEVKEISCWKVWDGERLKDWLCFTRKLEEEDLFPKRRVLIEIRGLPIKFRSEENLEKMTQKYGLWG